MSNKIELQNNNTDLRAILDAVNALPDAGGVELPELTNEATAADMLSGKQLIDDEGNVITGTFTIDNELNTQDALITQLSEILDTKAAASGNAFPYNVTITTSGLSNVDPIICYGDDGDTVFVVTKVNLGAIYKTSWSCTNCTLHERNWDGDLLGNWAVFYNFTGDAVISINWTLSGDGGQ